MKQRANFQKLSNSDRGLYSEYLVYKNFLGRGFELVDHRLRTLTSEIDLLFYDPKSKTAIMIEVKSHTHDAFLNVRVGLRQKQKLRATQLHLQAWFDSVIVLLAVVRHDASIELFENFLS